jgi:hypothetical protein
MSCLACWILFNSATALVSSCHVTSPSIWLLFRGAEDVIREGSEEEEDDDIEAEDDDVEAEDDDDAEDGADDDPSDAKAEIGGVFTEEGAVTSRRRNTASWGQSL